MSAIFINYRREDSSGYAGRLYDRLVKHFGRKTVFLDMSGSIQHGEPYDKAIERAVDSCDVFLAIIGKNWLLCTDTAGKRRLEDSNDFVRIEIAKALERNVRVIPVLVQQAIMPNAEDLPQDLKPLAKHQAIELTDHRWDFDLSQLIVTIKKILNPPPPNLWWLRVAAGILLLAAVAFGFWTFWLKQNPSSENANEKTSVLNPLCNEPLQWDSELNSCIRKAFVPAKKFSIPLGQSINKIKGNIYFYLNRERLANKNGIADYKNNPGVVQVEIPVMRDNELVGTAREVIYTTSEGNICNISDLPETTGHLKDMKVGYSIELIDCLQPNGICTVNLDPNGKRVTVTLKPFALTIGKDCKGQPHLSSL